MKRSLLILIAAALAAAPLLANAQSGGPPPFSAASKTYQIAVSNVSSTPVQVVPNNPNFAGCVQYLFSNSGTTDAWVAMGTSSAGTTAVAATTVTPSTSFLLPAGSSEVRTAFLNAYVAAITAASTTTLNVSCGSGAVYSATTSSSSGGTVTASQGTPAATADAWPVKVTDGTDVGLVTAAGEQNVLATAQPGVDIGDVTVNNAAGASAVNVQDGGNSLTVDAPLATPVHVRPSDGTDAVNVTAAGELNVIATAQPGVDVGDVTVNNAAGATSVPVQGAAATDSAVAGNPVLLGGRASFNVPTAVSTDGDAAPLWLSLRGGLFASGFADAEGDNASNTGLKFVDEAGVGRSLSVKLNYFDGATWDRVVGDSSNGLKTYQGAPAAASILAGSQSYTATQAATTIITIPAGNTWVGQVSISASTSTVAGTATAGQALGVVTTTGAGTTPAAGQVMDCEARNGANAATGTVGAQGNNSCTLDMIIHCASGTCTIAGATTQAGTASRVSFSAAGRLY